MENARLNAYAWLIVELQGMLKTRPSLDDFVALETTIDCLEDYLIENYYEDYENIMEQVQEIYLYGCTDSYETK
jgi:hypothetical protein